MGDQSDFLTPILTADIIHVIPQIIGRSLIAISGGAVAKGVHLAGRKTVICQI